MKRLFSIFFLLLFLFNIGGYYFVFVGLQYKASREFSERLDNNEYNEEETYLFKLPLTLPYQITENGYERVSGLIEHQGNFYRLVKQKLENDTLFVICIRDNTQKQLAGELSKFAKLSNDIPVTQTSKPGDGNSTNLLSRLSKDFNVNKILEVLSPQSSYVKAFYASVEIPLVGRDQKVPTPPPKSPVG